MIDYAKTMYISIKINPVLKFIYIMHRSNRVNGGLKWKNSNVLFTYLLVIHYPFIIVIYKHWKYLLKKKMSKKNKILYGCEFVIVEIKIYILYVLFDYT